MAIWCYESNGDPCTDFGTGGIVTHNNAAGGDDLDSGRSLSVDSSGRVLVTGFSRNASGDDDMVIWRYTPDGDADTTFGDPDGFGGRKGFTVHNNAAGGNGSDMGLAIVLDSSGRVLVTGNSANATGNIMAIWCYEANGDPYTDFGAGGVCFHSNAGGGQGRFHYPGCLRAYPGDRGEYKPANNDMVIWRYAGYNPSTIPTPATVNLTNMTQTYTGSPLTRQPPPFHLGLDVIWYGVPKTAVGNYFVAAMINEETTGYQGSAHGWFTIEPAIQAQAINVTANHRPQPSIRHLQCSCNGWCFGQPGGHHVLWWLPEVVTIAPPLP